MYHSTYFQKEEFETIPKTTFNQTSSITFTTNSTVIVECEAQNSVGDTRTIADVIVNDLKEDFSIWSDNELPISSGDDVTVTCGASAHKYAKVDWYKDDVLIENSTGWCFNENTFK